MLRVPTYRASLVNPYREHLRKRRAEDPGVAIVHLFNEIKALGYEGCLNLLHKYINQGRADADRSHISPRRLARMLLSRPDTLTPQHRDLLARRTAACPEMTQLAAAVAGFAELLTPQPANTDRLSHWMIQVRAAELPHLHAFTPGPGARPRRRERRHHAPRQQRPHRRRQHQNQTNRPPKCTDEQASPCSATASSSDSNTHRHHRK